MSNFERLPFKVKKTLNFRWNVSIVTSFCFQIWGFWLL
jgi:hypothetical protein